jgi:2-succinyl-6-hydroxy-2,4-cyclohexadiene-1-carboxylate synthase
MNLAHRASGVGGRPLVLLHGLAGSGDDFAQWLDRLAGAGWHAIAPDLRGHGASPKPDDESAYSLRSLARDVVELVDELGLESVTVLGHEVGGLVAQELAVTVPHRLHGLVLQATCPGPLPIERHLALAGAELVRGASSMSPLVQVYRDLHGGPLSTPVAQQEAVLGRMLECAPAAYASLLTQLLDAPDRSLLLSEVRVPTLVLVGAHDAAYLESSVDVAGVMPRADLAIMPSAGHLPHVTSPDEWLVFLKGFLQASLSTEPAKST